MKHILVVAAVGVVHGSTTCQSLKETFMSTNCCDPNTDPVTLASCPKGCAPLPTLRILNTATWAPPQHTMNVPNGVFHVMNESLKTCSSNSLMLSTLTYTGMAPPVIAATMMSPTTSLEVTWMANSYFYSVAPSERITSAELTNLPFPNKNVSASSLSYAYQKVWNDFGLEAVENKTLKYLSHFAHGPTWMGSKSRVSSVEDFKSLDVRIGGNIQNDIVSTFEVNSTHSTRPPDLPAAIVDGTVDSVLFPAETGFVFGSLLDYWMDARFGSTDFSVIMTPSAYNSLSSDHKACIAELSAPEFARTIGQFWDNADTFGISQLAAQGKTIYPIPTDVKTKLVAAVPNLVTSVKSRMNAKINRDALYDTFATYL